MKTNDERFEVDPYESSQAEAKLDVPFLGHVCTFWVILEEEATISDRQLQVLESILEASDEFRSELNKAALIYYQVADGDPAIVVDSENISRNYSPYMFIVPSLCDTEEDYFIVNCSCTWDTEHSMSIGAKNMAVVHYGANDGIRTWDEIEEEIGKQK